MRRDELYLSDIVEAADSIASFLSGRGRDAFLSDDLLRSAVLHKLTIIGEAAARVSAELRDRHPEIEWADIVGFRNIAVHAYFVVDWSIVWVTATQDAPELRRQAAEILSSEFEAK
ncbi:MAG TPA: DUF86 domain-containing protein [Pyrinomonadaceae bacterium]|jgi:uncharacterized protein with HEPN domain